MLRGFGLLIVVIAATSTCMAQSVCRLAASSGVENRDGIAVRIVSFPAPYENLTAHVYLPKGPAPVPGIVFPYSRITAPSGQVNMLVWARAIARAGAATIVLDGTLDLLLQDSEARRPGEQMACASQWLLANATLDMQRLAEAGPSTWGGGKTPHCNGPEEIPCFEPKLALDRDSAYRIFQNKMDPGARMRQAKSLSRHFKIAEMKLEWLEGMTSGASD